VSTTITTTTTTTTGHGIDGAQYVYDTGNGAPRMAPVGSAGAAFDQARFASKSSSSSSSSYLASGSGGQPGSYDGASTPVFGLDGTKLSDASATSPARTSDGGPLQVPALVAVIALAGVLAALVRTHQAHRAATKR